MARKSLYSLLKEVEELKTRAEKIERLRQIGGSAMTVLDYTYNPLAKWLLPEGEPPYKPLSENSDVEGQFLSELRRLYLFIEGNTPTQKNLKQNRREQLFVELLESIDPKDAKLLIGMKDGKLPFKGITKKLTCEAFPEMTKNW
jgi:hypothetical protein